MDLPNLKQTAHSGIDSIEDSVVGLFQIAADSKGHTSLCVGGAPDIIVYLFAKIMRENHQIKDIIEAAWCDSIDGPNIN